VREGREEKANAACLGGSGDGAGICFGGAGTARADNRAPKGPDEDGTKPALVKIAGEGMMDSHAFQYLTELSDDIGSRVTGSPAERKAEEWCVAKMKAMGLENVRTEKYQLWRGWTRGTAQAEMLEPIHRALHVDAMGWTGSTPTRGAEGEVVTANLFDIDEEVKKRCAAFGEGCAGGDAGCAKEKWGFAVRHLRRFPESGLEGWSPRGYRRPSRIEGFGNEPDAHRHSRI